MALRTTCLFPLMAVAITVAVLFTNTTRVECKSIFASGLSRPRGVAFNHSGNLFVVTNTLDSVSGTFQPSIVKITPEGVQSTFATLSGNLFGEGVAFDSS